MGKRTKKQGGTGEKPTRATRPRKSRKTRAKHRRADAKRKFKEKALRRA